MARITIEDCLKKRDNNRFAIIIEAAKRAREILDGAEARVDLRDDKPPVTALREIAADAGEAANDVDDQE